jgi:hypothetical protein
MPTSTPVNRIQTPPAFLFGGPPGGGKTTCALGFPNPFIVDCDLNLIGPERYFRDVLKSDKEFKYEVVNLDANNNVINNDHERWLRAETIINQACNDPWTKTIVIDSLSLLSKHIIAWIMWKEKKSEMRIQDWIPFAQVLTTILIKCRMKGKMFILTCHDSVERNDKGDITEYTVNVSSGKVRDLLPGVFSDFYRFDRMPGAGANPPTFRILPQRDGLSRSLKNSYLMPSLIEIPKGGSAFAELNKYLKLPT